MTASGQTSKSYHLNARREQFVAAATSWLVPPLRLPGCEQTIFFDIVGIFRFNALYDTERDTVGCLSSISCYAHFKIFREAALGAVHPTQQCSGCPLRCSCMATCARVKIEPTSSPLKLQPQRTMLGAARS